MIFQENDFLKTYNDMNKLWESTESYSYEFSFVEVIQRAVEQSTGQHFDRAYWTHLRELLDLKLGRSNQGESGSWYSRFITFYLEHAAEAALVDKFNNTESIPATLTLTAGERQALLYFTEYDLGKGFKEVILPDFMLSSRDARKAVKAECKTWKANASSLTSTHRAKFIFSHTPLSKNAPASQTCKFILTGPESGLIDIFGSAYNEFKWLNGIKDSDTKLNVASIKRRVLELTSQDFEQGLIVEVPCAADNLEELFAKIDGLLEESTETVATSILDAHTRDIGNSVAKLTKEPVPLDKPFPSQSLSDAEANIMTAVTALAAAQIDKKKSS